jgi:hypothetical protein
VTSNLQIDGGKRPQNSFVLCVIAIVVLLSPRAMGELSGDIRVGPPAQRPQLFFACCNGGWAAAQSLFADGRVIASLQRLNAGVAIATDDLSPARAQIVQRLNGAGIPVVAWFVVPGEQGYYINSGNAPQAAGHFSAFQQWSAEYRLRWNAIGLDIEPDIRLFEDLQHHRARLALQSLIRYFELGKMHRAREAYGDLIHRMQSQGYIVQTYQLPFIVAERQAHVTVLERLLGIVDVRGNEEVVMIYTGFNKAVGSAMIWTLGADSQEIAIGSTAGDEAALSWNDFSRDLIVAAHFSKVVGIFNLEGSVQHDYLSRLETMDWNQGVSITAQSLTRARRLLLIAGIALWLGDLAPFLILGIALALAWAVLRLCLRVLMRSA